MSLLVAAFSGSLRKESFNTKLVRAFQKAAPKSVTCEIIEIGHLPFINEDLESALPPSVKNLQSTIARADAILLCTPEYNRSYSPVLKNALDWGSRPEGTNKWAGKPAAVIGCTPYHLGAFGAQNHLRQVLMYLDMRPLQQPEFYLSEAAEKFNKQGQLIDPVTRKKVKEMWTALVTWTNKLK
ncbi:MAG TPA: NAD(P)H-dependent oxidoreductase [Candidatus Acidoferrum sp.]|jgi:chromate reductase